ncbi:MAG: stress response protein [Deltaproteobacteria bacterium]|nr:stress response protein [Deltaproteobacteria bacterium]
MAELKKKVTLKAKGEEAYVSIKQLLISLKWSTAVDLDLVAFYKAKDGRTGGVFSDNYSGGSLGSLNSFPFIQLSGDAGVGAKGGESEETLRVTKLDEIAELWICALNFTEASAQRNTPFNGYNAMVQLVDDKGEGVEAPLSSTDKGTVAIICLIDNKSPMGAKMVSQNRVVDMATFHAEIPGAAGLQIATKVVLKAKGQSVMLKKKTGSADGGGFGEISVNLNWNQTGKKPTGGFLSRMMSGGGGNIDLDLGCLWELSLEGETLRGAVQPLGKRFGSFDNPPFISHSGDDRTGASSTGETLRINGERAQYIKRVLVFTYIYEGAAKWSQADGLVTIKQGSGPPIEVALDSHKDGVMMCAIAMFENSGAGFSVKKLLEYFPGHEEMDNYYKFGLRWTAGSKD